MNNPLRKHQGITMLELLLVMVIASSFIILALRHYYSLKRDADVRQVVANVNLLFQSAAQYYQQQCYPQSSNSTMFDPTTGYLSVYNLNNTHGDLPTQSTVLVMSANELRTEGVLVDPLVSSYIVDNNSDLGYIVQYNINYPITNREVLTYGNVTRNYYGIALITTQVSVKLADPTLANNYRRLLKADCVADLGEAAQGGNAVQRCSNATPGASTYLVWERMPSRANEKTPMWLTNPTVKQFNQMYQLYPINYSLTYNNNDKKYWLMCGG